MGNFDSRSLLKMNITTWLSVLLVVISLGTPAATSERRVVCYYTNWSVYRPGTARFNPQNINPYLCTHLIYAFGGFTKDNTLKPFDKYQDIEKGGYAKFTGLKTYNRELKTLLAIGGWNEGSTRFSPMVASREKRKEFVRNAIKFLRQNHFDGLDLDWEYPAFRDGGKAKDRENYARLVRELREEFERESEKTGKPRLLLTMAVPAGIEYIQKGFDVKTLNRYLDWMNLLTYDYHSAFEPAVNHHAPLYPLEEPNEYSVDNELNIDYTIKFYLESGADADKLVLGIPTYGRSYTLFNPAAVEIGSPADGPGEQGDATREKGYLAYYEICESLRPTQTKKRRQAPEDDSEEEEERDEDTNEPWTVMYPNPDAMGPIAYKGNQWVGYDDVNIVRKKAEYVAENGLGGIMFWSIDNDDFRGVCHEKPYPLIEAAKEAYFQKVGSSTRDQKPKETLTRPSTRKKTKPRSTTTTTSTTSKPTTKSSKRTTSTTPSWAINTPEPPTTPDPGADFKCVDEGFYPHPRDCKKYFWCLDSGPSNLGIVAHQFTCPSGLYFNKAADSCDFARNVPCKKPAQTTKAPTTKPVTRTTSTTTTTTTRRPIKLSTKTSSLFRTTSTTTTVAPQSEEYEYEDELQAPSIEGEEDAEDPKVIKELIDLIKKVGGIEQLEKQLGIGEGALNKDGADVITTTPSTFNKKLYQKVLERTRSKNKYDNNIIESTQNSRSGPQNAGLEVTNDRDKLLKRDRPQYITINRHRGSSTTESFPEEPRSIEEQEAIQDDQHAVRAKSVDARPKVGTTVKPLQYVNIRRGRPTVQTSDTADDTASRNALFERAEALVTVSETPSTLDLSVLRRENAPEYVTIRRQRPTTEETTTVQYEGAGSEEDLQETALEREISTQPQYSTIVRSRSTTLPPEEPSSVAPLIRIRSTTLPTETSSPDPTTVLAVQISSLLNSQSSTETDIPDTEAPVPTSEVIETTTTTTTTTAAPTRTPLSPTRRTNIIRRRGSTTTTTSAPSTVSQVSPRNYTFVSRNRHLRRPNEIFSDSDDNINVSRKIRSTTPDSREVNGVAETGTRRFRSRFQVSQARNDDSVPAAASPVSRGQFRPDILSADEVISLTPIDVEPQFVPKQSFSSRTERRFRRPQTAATTVSETAPDSEVSAATVEARRPNLLPRGRNRFTLSSTTDATVQATTTTPLAQRRPTFARFTPRPFTRPSPSPISIDVDETEFTEEPITQRNTPRLLFDRTRPTLTVAARKLPFPSRSSTTQQPLNNDDFDDDEPETRSDDILLSESARAEEHNEPETEVEEEAPKRRIVIKKLRASSPSNEDITSTENIPIEEPGKRKFRVIRRRPASTTTTLEPSISTEAPTATALQRIRKVIRKKIRPAEDEPEITAKSINLHNTGKGSTPESFNYGEKTKAPPTTTLKEAETEPSIELVTEFYKEEKKIDLEIQPESKDISEQISETVEEKQEEKVITETTIAPSNIEADRNIKINTVENIEVKTEIVTPLLNEQEPNARSECNSKECIRVSDDKAKIEIGSGSNSESKVVVEIGTEEIDISQQKEKSETEKTATESESPQTETTTTSTTILTSPSSRSRLPYRPRKKVFTPSTEPPPPSSSKTFSRKYNPGAYTSPATADKPQFRPTGATRRPFSSKIFTRRPFTPRTTQKEEDEEYNDEEVLEEGDEPQEDNPFVFVPPNQLFTRKPDSSEYDDDAGSEELLEEGDKDNNDEEIAQDDGSSRFSPTTRRPGFKPRVVNSNTFRTSTTTTEIPKRFENSRNRTSILTRFGGNKPISDNKKRVQNVPQGYNSPVDVSKLKGAVSKSEVITTTAAFASETESTTVDDDYLTDVTTNSKDLTTFNDLSTTNTIESETATIQMEIDDSTDDYLEYIESTTNFPNTQQDSNTESEIKTTILQNTAANTYNTEVTTEQIATTKFTTPAPVSPIIKTQFNKLFSVSRVVEVNSKLDKHRVNKKNETTHIEEGQIMVEKKPVENKIGEVSRYTLIKIVEDEIPIYLTKLGHVYPVAHPPDNIIRIDEARNARALNDNLHDVTRENLVASESVNEAYRHVKQAPDSQDSEDKGHIEHLPSDDFLTYVNKNDKEQDNPLLYAQWQFVPAAYENEKVRTAKSFDIVTPRSMLTKPSTLPLEGLFKTEMPYKARKVSDEKNQPFVVYSASVPSQQEDANIVKLSVLKPETGRSIITFAKGQEFNGASTVEEATVKSSINVSIFPQVDVGSTLSAPSTTPATMPSTTTFGTTTTKNLSSPIIDLLSTTQITNEVTSVSTTEAITTETSPEESTTVKVSPLDAKRAKFAFPRRQIIKSSNFTRPSVAPRTVKKLNSTVSTNLHQKLNKTTFSPSKSRYTANRVQNVPVDIKKKSNTTKIGKIFTTTKSYTTESPKTTTERKSFFKPIRPGFRPSFVPRKTTPSPTTEDT